VQPPQFKVPPSPSPISPQSAPSDSHVGGPLSMSGAASKLTDASGAAVHVFIERSQYGASTLEHGRDSSQ
jgi:hypothetical protein